MTLPKATRNCQRHNLGTILLLLISGTLAVAATTSQIGDGKSSLENCETVGAQAEVDSSTSVLHEPCGEHAESTDQGEARRIHLVRSLSDDIGENLHATLADSAQETTWTKFDKVVIAHAVMGSVAWMIVRISGLSL